MEIEFEKPKIKPLTKTHLEQMLVYCHEWEKEECYYGNKAQFYKRHEHIKNWLEDCLEKLQ
jgi:hypothetical protein